MRMRGLASVFMAAALGFWMGADAPVGGAGVVKLFDGKTLDGWKWVGGTPESKITDAFLVKEGVLHCATKPVGTIFRSERYKDYVLTIEYRHVTKGNGGVFVCVGGEEKVLPDGVQVQLKSGSVGDLINQNKGMKGIEVDKARTTDTNKDLVTKKMKEGVEKEIGEWNTLVITVKAGTLKVELNGVLVNEAKGLVPAEGKVGLQSEGAEMEYRKMELAPL